MDRGLNPLNPEDLDELLGAYALDALDADEREAVERYLEHNPRARAEVIEHREVAAMLAFSGAAAPDGLWDRIAGAIGDAPVPEFRLPLAPVVPIDRRRRLTSRLALAGAAAAVVVIAALGVTVVNQGHRIDRLNSAMGADAIATGATRALADPQAHLVELRTEQGVLSAQVVLQPDGTGYLVSRDMPALDTDSTYQLWGVVGSQVISLGVLGPAPKVAAFHVSGSPSTLLVTREAAGGVAVTRNTPILSGQLD